MNNRTLGNDENNRDENKRTNLEIELRPIWQGH